MLFVNSWLISIKSSNSSADNAKKSFVIDGKRFVKTNVHRIQYRFCEAAADNHRLGKSSLVDRGDNGGLAGEDICVIEHTLRKADIIGINDHTVVGLPIVTPLEWSKHRLVQYV